MKKKMYMKAAAVITAGMLMMTGCGNAASGGAQTNTSAEETNTETAESAGEGEENTEEVESLENSQGNTEEAESAVDSDSLVLKEQSMFSAGGTVITSDGTFDVSNYYTSREGSTSHVDHANVFYQIPKEDTGLPMVFLHGYGQSRMGWMTTPDGREGWSDMFLKKGHSVFLIDQPRRGEAGQTSVAGTINAETADQTWYTQFRIGTFLDGEFTYNENSQFPRGEEVLDQFFRQMTPDTGDFDMTVIAQAVAATIDEAYEKTGKDSILVTHS